METFQTRHERQMRRGRRLELFVIGVTVVLLAVLIMAGVLGLIWLWRTVL